jgi:hypothetical protein
MPHESTVDPEEPMHFKSWGDEPSQSDTPDRRRTTFDMTNTPRFNQSVSMQTHPDLPLHVTHDHDDDGDPDDESISTATQDSALKTPSRVTYIPPKRKHK